MLVLSARCELHASICQRRCQAGQVSRSLGTAQVKWAAILSQMPLHRPATVRGSAGSQSRSRILQARGGIIILDTSSFTYSSSEDLSRIFEVYEVRLGG